MEIIHHVGKSSSPEVMAELADIGITVEVGGIVVTFDIAESHEAWPKVKQWIALRGAFNTVSTKFSRKEIAEAKWLELQPSWHHGYPQPEPDVFGYLPVTYDLSNYCTQCGAGARQHAPFRMKAEPKWGRNEILQLNWIFGEYFVTPELWARVFETHGVACREVLNKKGNTLQTVVQLVVTEEVEIEVDGLPAEKCGKCRRVKFIPHVRGEFPAFVSEPTGQMARTTQIFGSGMSWFQPVLVSQKLAAALVDVRGASLRPIAEHRAQS